MRIAIGSIKHESNTNSPNRTNIECFKRKQYLIGNEIVEFHKNRKTEIGGFLSVALPSNEIFPTISVDAISSGMVERVTFEFLYNKLLSMLSSIEFDAIFLCLHGSMCVDEIEDPEGFLLKNLRNRYPKIIIGCTLDHHANVSKEMVENSDFLVSFRTHPHIDQFETGLRAGTLMGVGKIKDFKKTFVQLPLITPAENMSEPIEILRTYTENLCDRSDVVSASFQVGYPWADVSIMGSSIYIIHSDEFPDNLIEEFSRLFWSLRDSFQFPIKPLSYIKDLNKNKSNKPYVLNELSDCIFGGSSGDVVTTATWLVKNCPNPSAVVGIVDKESVEKAFTLGIGNKGDFLIGGKICTKGNPPLQIYAEVVSIFEDLQPKSIMAMEEGPISGKLAVIRSKSVDIILVEYPSRVGGAALFDAIGLSTSNYKFIVVKEGLNPFVTYEGICEEIVMIDSPGFNPQKLTSEMYKKVNRKLYPIFEVGLDEKIVSIY